MKKNQYRPGFLRGSYMVYVYSVLKDECSFPEKAQMSGDSWKHFF